MERARAGAPSALFKLLWRSNTSVVSSKADAVHVLYIGQIAKRIFIISRDMTGRADSNMISDALAGAVFASQTGTICRVSGRLTSWQSHTKYGRYDNFGRNI